MINNKVFFTGWFALLLIAVGDIGHCNTASLGSKLSSPMATNAIGLSSSGRLLLRTPLPSGEFEYALYDATGRIAGPVKSAVDLAGAVVFENGECIAWHYGNGVVGGNPPFGAPQTPNAITISKLSPTLEMTTLRVGGRGAPKYGAEYKLPSGGVMDAFPAMPLISHSVGYFENGHAVAALAAYDDARGVDLWRVSSKPDDNVPVMQKLSLFLFDSEFEGKMRMGVIDDHKALVVVVSYKNKSEIRVVDLENWEVVWHGSVVLTKILLDDQTESLEAGLKYIRPAASNTTELAVWRGGFRVCDRRTGQATQFAVQANADGGAGSKRLSVSRLVDFHQQP